MSKSSFEQPIQNIVNQYGEHKDAGALALITGNTTAEEVAQVQQKTQLLQGLFVNFGQDNARQHLAHARNISREQGITLQEVQISDLASSFIDDSGELSTYDESTVISTLVGIAADYALYNGITAVYILESFENSEVLHLLPQYYFSINEQLASIAGQGRISLFGKTNTDTQLPETLSSGKSSANAKEKLILTMLSGGPDSSVLLSELVRRYYEQAIVEAIFINFGQPYMAQELLSARNIANLSRVRLREISVAGISQSFVGKGEIGVGYPILRNLINSMYGLASDYSRYRKANELHHANIKEDVTNLPWMTDFFASLDRTSQVISSASGSNVQVKSEYLSLPKAEVITRGYELIGEQLGSTFSCLTSGTVGKHCGRCRSCKNRRKAFIAAQVQDQTKYEVEPDVGSVELYEAPTQLI